MVEPDDAALAGAHARATAAEERLRAQTLVRAEAEHRLKTSLAVITGWAVTLDERWDQLPLERRRQAVGVIRRASEALAEQARGLLEEARADLLILDEDPVELDLGAALSVTSTVFDGMGGHRIETVTPEPPVMVAVDPAALQQVIGHLLENAVKYSPEHSTVVIAVRRVDADAVIEIRDQGRGVPDGIDLFEPFKRGPGTDDVAGVGLGLYIVRNLVQAMGGEVSARRNPDCGSTFSVRLPSVVEGTKDPGRTDQTTPNMGACPTSGTGTTSRS